MQIIEHVSLLKCFVGGFDGTVCSFSFNLSNNAISNIQKMSVGFSPVVLRTVEGRKFVWANSTTDAIICIDSNGQCFPQWLCNTFSTSAACPISVDGFANCFFLLTADPAFCDKAYYRICSIQSDTRLHSLASHEIMGQIVNSCHHYQYPLLAVITHEKLRVLSDTNFSVQYEFAIPNGKYQFLSVQCVSVLGTCYFVTLSVLFMEKYSPNQFLGTYMLHFFSCSRIESNTSVTYKIGHFDSFAMRQGAFLLSEFSHQRIISLLSQPNVLLAEIGNEIVVLRLMVLAGKMCVTVSQRFNPTLHYASYVPKSLDMLQPFDPLHMVHMQEHEGYVYIFTSSIANASLRLWKLEIATHAIQEVALHYHISLHTKQQLPSQMNASLLMLHARIFNPNCIILSDYQQNIHVLELVPIEQEQYFARVNADLDDMINRISAITMTEEDEQIASKTKKQEAMLIPESYHAYSAPKFDPHLHIPTAPTHAFKRMATIPLDTYCTTIMQGSISLDTSNHILFTTATGQIGMLTKSKTVHQETFCS